MSLPPSATEMIIQRFKHHPPLTEGRVHAHEELRQRFTDLALWLEEALPSSREKSVAHTALQEAAMWGNAALAIHEDPGF